MIAEARVTPFAEIEHLWRLHRGEADCQIVRDSILPRGLASPFALEVDGHLVGYAGVWTEHFPGRVMELYVVPEARTHLEPCFIELLRESGANAIEAQTNMPLLHGVLRRFATEIRVENILFGEPADGGGQTRDPLSPSEVRFRRRESGDGGPSGEWVLAREAGGTVVAAGGFLQHYNPPYCDLFMEVVPDERGRGYGSHLVQELRTASREAGLIPAARCDVGNEASRRTLTRGGLVECGQIVAGRVQRFGAEQRHL